MTVFKKVKIEERKPENYVNVFFITTEGHLTSGHLSVGTGSYLVNSSFEFEDIEFWLEEVELPEINEIAADQKGRDYSINASQAHFNGAEFVLKNLT